MSGLFDHNITDIIIVYGSLNFQAAYKKIFAKYSVFWLRYGFWFCYISLVFGIFFVYLGSWYFGSWGLVPQTIFTLSSNLMKTILYSNWYYDSEVATVFFAHATTAQLSWHVQKFCSHYHVENLDTRLTKFVSNLNLKWKYVSDMVPAHM